MSWQWRDAGYAAIVGYMLAAGAWALADSSWWAAVDLAACAVWAGWWRSSRRRRRARAVAEALAVSAVARSAAGSAVADNAQLSPGWFEVSPEARRHLSDEDLAKLNAYNHYTAEDVAEARRLYGGKIHDDD